MSVVHYHDICPPSFFKTDDIFLHVSVFLLNSTSTLSLSVSELSANSILMLLADDTRAHFSVFVCRSSATDVNFWLNDDLTFSPRVLLASCQPLAPGCQAPVSMKGVSRDSVGGFSLHLISDAAHVPATICSALYTMLHARSEWFTVSSAGRDIQSCLSQWPGNSSLTLWPLMEKKPHSSVLVRC